MVAENATSLPNIAALLKNRSELILSRCRGGVLQHEANEARLHLFGR
jgi:hypothetical protein